MALETQIPPPAFPFVVALNQFVTDQVFSAWVQKHLVPAGYTVRVTGDSRSYDRNQAVGGAENSAHLHGLAKDFQLLKNGQPVSAAEAHRVFKGIIAPSWQGYAQDETDTKNHIHVNLSREITPAMTVAAVAVSAALGYAAWKLIKDAA